MEQRTTDRVKAIVETWNVQKLQGREFNTNDMYRFVEMMNDRTRHMIATFRVKDPEFYQQLAMTAGTAAEVIDDTVVVDPFAFARARVLITNYSVNEAEFYTGLQELCVHASTLTTAGARVIADGVDRTNL
jgi:hypothetical protein